MFTFQQVMAQDLTGDGGCLREITGNKPCIDGCEASYGQVVQAGDHIWAHYEGSCEGTGEVFDASFEKPHRQPYGFDFVVGQGAVIKGWDIGFQGMKVGDEATLTLRSDYAYGDHGAPPQIPGGATLIFKVQLNRFERS